MRLTFLGSGTSGGVPSLGCRCEVCRSEDPHDKRLRQAALLETGATRILIDCGPDIRQQLMPLPFLPIDGILLTHIHYDHVAGIDDLRPFCQFKPLEVYANAQTAAGLRHNMPYFFAEKRYPGVAHLRLHEVVPHQAFRIGDVEVMPFEVMHGQMPIMAYRFGRLAYITDMKSIDPQEMEWLEGVDTLVVNALRWEKPHHSHMLVPDAVAFARQVGAKRTCLIHLTHLIGFHREAGQRLPEGVELAYDGLTLEL